MKKLAPKLHAVAIQVILPKPDSFVVAVIDRSYPLEHNLQSLPMSEEQANWFVEQFNKCFKKGSR